MCHVRFGQENLAAVGNCFEPWQMWKIDVLNLAKLRKILTFPGRLDFNRRALFTLAEVLHRAAFRAPPAW